ncbi:MAG: type I-MYXAN CRISPR-associated Cas8a1/Cmx1 [Microcystaceae cyanobacterium]
MVTAIKPKIYLDLGAKDTTLAERAGILGLWMTLTQLEKQYPDISQRPGDLSWKLTPRSVSIDWQGEDSIVLDWLFKQSFKVDKRGLVTFTGLSGGYLPLLNKVHQHNVLRKTLWQYNGSVTTAKTLKISGFKFIKKTPQFVLYFLIILPYPWLILFLKLDDQALASFQKKGIKINLYYSKFKDYYHQDFAEKICSKRSQNLKKGYVPIVSRLYPGATVKHEQVRASNIYKEKLEYAFALLFLPVACHYLILHRSEFEQEHKKPLSYILVIPDPIDFEKMAQVRWRLNQVNYEDLFVSSLGEAAFSYFRCHSPDIPIKRCQVALYEKLMADKKLNFLTGFEDFELTSKAIQTYKIAQKTFQPNRFHYTKNQLIIRLNLIRGIIADNLATQNPFWLNVTATFQRNDTYGEMKTQLKYNSKGLRAMIQEDDETLAIYTALIEVIHSTLRIIYGKISAKNPSNFRDKIDLKNGQWKEKFIDCRTQKDFRKLLTKFLSEAHHSSQLAKSQALILPILTGKQDWEEARDITVIALSSYQGKGSANLEEIEFFSFCLLFEAEMYQFAWHFC